MKNIYLFLLIGLCFCNYSTSAQTDVAIKPLPEYYIDGCGTPDPTEQEYQSFKWYGDTLYLDNYYDSLLIAHNGNNNYRTVVGGIEPVWLRIPIQFWVYTEGSTPAPGHTRFPTEADFQRLIDNVNDGYRNNGVPVRFYMLCPRFINDPDAVTINNATEGFFLITNNKTYGAVNVHISQNTTNLYNPLADGILISRATFVPQFNQVRESSLTHEIGHYFGLQHTFFGSKIPCQREPVSRGYVWRPFCPQNLFPKTSAVTGDFLSDTEADHEDIPAEDIDMNCIYTGNRTDFWGQRFRPNGRNYMAYHPTRCRGLFTPQQRSVMLNNMFRKRAAQLAFGGWDQSGTVTEFDRWEPDNAAITARLLPLDEAQIHSMQGRGCGADNEDWMRFNVPAAGETSSYILEVRDVPGYSNPVASAQVFTSRFDVTTSLQTADTPVTAQLLSNSNGVRRWLLTCNTLNSQAGRNLFIRIASNNNMLGRYQVTLQRNLNTILGPAKVCPNTNTLYSIGDLLPNSTVTWTVSPSSVAVISVSTGSTTSLQTFSSGQATLQAVVSENGCTRTLPALSVDVGGPPPPNIQLVDDPSACGYPIVHYSISDYDPSFTYTITNRVRASGSSIIGSAFWVKSGAGATTGSFTLTVSNGCGSTSIDIDVNYPQPCEYSPYTYTVAPNPTSDEIVVEQHQIPSTTVKRDASTTSSNSSNSEPISSVQIYDNYGRLRLTQLAQGPTIRLALHTLPDGLYIVHIMKGQKVVSRHQLKVLR